MSAMTQPMKRQSALYEAPLRSPTTTPAEQQAIAEATKAEAVKPNA